MSKVKLHIKSEYQIIAAIITPSLGDWGRFNGGDASSSQNPPH